MLSILFSPQLAIAKAKSIIRILLATDLTPPQIPFRNIPKVNSISELRVPQSLEWVLLIWIICNDHPIDGRCIFQLIFHHEIIANRLCLLEISFRDQGLDLLEFWLELDCVWQELVRCEEERARWTAHYSRIEVRTLWKRCHFSLFILLIFIYRATNWIIPRSRRSKEKK